MMNVNTIVLDELMSFSVIANTTLWQKSATMFLRDHQMIYISATNKIDDQVLVENTIVYDLSDQELDTIKHYYISVDKRNRVELLRKFSNIWLPWPCLFQHSFWPWCYRRAPQFNGASAVSLASDINVKFRKVILEKFRTMRFHSY